MQQCLILLTHPSQVSLFCNQQLCLILIFPPSQVWCNSVAPWPRTRSFLVGSPPSVTLTTRVIPLKSTLWTLTAPRRASQGSAPGTGDTWPWCPTRSAAPWAGSGPGPRGTSDLLSHLHHGYVCSRTLPPGAAAQSDNTLFTFLVLPKKYYGPLGLWVNWNYNLLI